MSSHWSPSEPLPTGSAAVCHARAKQARPRVISYWAVEDQAFLPASHNHHHHHHNNNTAWCRLDFFFHPPPPLSTLPSLEAAHDRATIPAISPRLSTRTSPGLDSPRRQLTLGLHAPLTLWPRLCTVSNIRHLGAARPRSQKRRTAQLVARVIELVTRPRLRPVQ